MTTNAEIIKFCNEQIRPDAERIRAAYARGIDSMAKASSTIIPIMIGLGLIVFDNQTGAISPAQDQGDVQINDGRAVDGVSQITISTFCTLVNTFGGLTKSIAENQDFINALSIASVRALEV